MAQIKEPQANDPTPDPQREPQTAKRRRQRVGRKRTAFRTLPRPAWPVRGLWESAPKEEREQAHRTCILILEYWLGKKSKAQVAGELGVKPLRIWQLSQQALSGMMAGLLKQPRRRVKASELLGMPIGKTPMMLEKKIASLERELARTEDLVRVLRMAPWQAGNSESPPKGGPRHGSRTVRKPKPRAARGAAANRENPPPPPPGGDGAGAGG